MKRYAGCLKDIEVSRTPYNLLSSSDYTGLTKGCSIEVSWIMNSLSLSSSDVNPPIRDGLTKQAEMQEKIN